MARTRCYCAGVLTDEDFPLAQISEHLTAPGALVWVDVCAPDAAELQLLSTELNLHALAVEDATHRGERPKLDRYTDHLFLSAYSVELVHDSTALRAHEIAAFITPVAFITVRKDDKFDIQAVTDRWDGSPDMLKHGVSFLLHGLLDTLVDSHFDAVQQLDEKIEGLEDLLFVDTTDQIGIQRRTFELRKSLVQLRRVVLPMREVINTILRRDLHLLDDEDMAPYFQDVYDHVLRATEWTESLRDLVTSALETNLTIQSNRLNVITKKVTSWAAIIAVPTAITGFYGQNIPYPGFGRTSGLITSCLIIGVLSALLYALFRHKDWL